MDSSQPSISIKMRLWLFSRKKYTGENILDAVKLLVLLYDLARVKCMSIIGEVTTIYFLFIKNISLDDAIVQLYLD